MKKKLLLSTAALLAGMSLASAQQHMPGGQTSGQERQPSAQGQSSQAQQGAREQSRQGQSQRSESGGQRDLTTGQGSQGAQAQPSQPPQGQAQPSQPGQVQQGQAQPQPQQSPGVTTGQSERAGAQQTNAAGGVTLTNEQRTRIRETVLARSDVPRVDRVDFALVVGTSVPSYVHVVEVPDTLIVIHPEWRGDMYFVAGDDVIIVDHTRHIVATLPVGSGTQSSTTVNERGSSTAMH